MMRWGILQRYVAKEVFRSFVLALTALTSILVLFVLVAQAAKTKNPAITSPPLLTSNACCWTIPTTPT